MHTHGASTSARHLVAKCCSAGQVYVAQPSQACSEEVELALCADGPVGIPSSRLQLNAAMAATLESPMLMTLDAPEGRSAEDLCNSAVIAAAECRGQHADILGVLLNRVSLPPASIRLWLLDYSRLCYIMMTWKHPARGSAAPHTPGSFCSCLPTALLHAMTCHTEHVRHAGAARGRAPASGIQGGGV